MSLPAVQPLHLKLGRDGVYDCLESTAYEQNPEGDPDDPRLAMVFCVPDDLAVQAELRGQ